MEEIYADPNQCEFNTDPICGYIGSIKSQESLDEDFKQMPQYLGEHEAKSKIKALPSIQGKPKQEKDTMNLTTLLSTPIECRLTLVKLLKIRPHLWNDLMETLQKMGVMSLQNKHIKQLKENNQTPTSDPLEQSQRIL